MERTIFEDFESWAGLLDGRLYNEFIIKPNKEISKKIREFSTETQIIHSQKIWKEIY